jgi:predicted lipoprotein with Yx(FWY)xxD motif
MPRLSAVLVLVAVAALVLGLHDLTRRVTAPPPAAMIAPASAPGPGDEAPEKAGAREAAEHREVEPHTTDLATEDLDIGTVVVSKDGATLYRSDLDFPRPSRSNCTAQCAVVWTPLLAGSGVPTVDGVDEALVGTVTRPEGTRQVTLAGWPLYRYSGDSPGEARGNEVGNGWHAVGPDGMAAVPSTIKAAPAPAVTPVPAPVPLVKPVPPVKPPPVVKPRYVPPVKPRYVPPPPPPKLSKKDQQKLEDQQKKAEKDAKKGKGKGKGK